ncbi:bifunctional phosphoribosyl-AMP cyclohydrolase/phosphoribosyl-ATP pyrophosphatase [Helicobacter bilis]|nr:bifunctional phosphoribosyl-AMP cyclohydrolase/phosphoribosyl-ATP pyrophosphatase [Helicobacter bilis]TLE03565.1 bifunctional phosphoribosyl-AMP cyclohydrolase/phosphoribosyl-ATP pyrophosphatase [Helicobacter bilis]
MRCLEYVARTESIKRVSTHKDIQACDKIVLPGVGAFGSAMEHLSARDLDKSLCEYAKSGRYMLGICLGMQLLFEKSYEFGEYKGLGLVEGFVAPFGSKDSIEWHIKTNMGFNDIESKGLDSTKSYPTPNNHLIEIESRFYKVCTLAPCTHPNGRESRFDTRCTPSPAPTHLVENLESIYTNIQTLYTTNNNKAQNTHLKIPHIGWNKNFIKKPHNLCASMKDSFYLYFVHSYHVCCDTRFIIAACDYGISFPSIIGKENILGIQPHPERSHEMGFKLMRDFLQLR